MWNITKQALEQMHTVQGDEQYAGQDVTGALSQYYGARMLQTTRETATGYEGLIDGPGSPSSQNGPASEAVYRNAPVAAGPVPNYSGLYGSAVNPFQAGNAFQDNFLFTFIPAKAPTITPMGYFSGPRSWYLAPGASTESGSTLSGLGIVPKALVTMPDGMTIDAATMMVKATPGDSWKRSVTLGVEAGIRLEAGRWWPAWSAAVETAGTPNMSPITEATLDLIGVGPDGQMERLGSSEEFTADDTWQEVDITAVCAAFLARRGEAWRTMFGMVGVGEYDATAPYAFQAITFAEVSQRTGSNGTEVYLFEGTSNQYAYANPSAVLGDWALTFRPTGGLLSAVLPTTRGVPRQLHGMV